MLIFDDQQFKSFAIGSILNFLVFAPSWLQEHFPDECAQEGEDVLNLRVANILEDAHKFGVRSQSDMLKMLAMSFVYGPFIHNWPDQVRAKLCDPEVEHVNERVHRVFAAAMQSVKAKETAKIEREKFENDH